MQGLKGGSLPEEGMLRDMSSSYNKMYKELIFIWGGWGHFSVGILLKSE